jgi:PEGA domain
VPDPAARPDVASVLAEINAAMERLAAVDKGKVPPSLAASAADRETSPIETSAKADTTGEHHAKVLRVGGEQDATTVIRPQGGSLAVNVPRSVALPEREDKPEAPPAAMSADRERGHSAITPAARSDAIHEPAPQALPARSERDAAVWPPTFVAEEPTQPRPPAARHWTAFYATAGALGIIAAVELGVFVWEVRGRAPAAAPPTTGTVAIESTPAGATIAIDGKEVGTTPWSSTLKPGAYAVAITTGAGTRQVPFTVLAGNSSQRIYFNESERNTSTAAEEPVAAPVAVAPAPVSAAGGWISISAPFDLQLVENGALIGSTRSERIMLPVGRHVITASNPSLGYETTTTMQVDAGAVARVKLAVPSGVLNVNALPWADVAIDGKRLGPTPLGNVSLPLGSHEIVFTHPQLGERRQTVAVTVNGPNRVSVDLSQR